MTQGRHKPRSERKCPVCGCPRCTIPPYERYYYCNNCLVLFDAQGKIHPHQEEKEERKVTPKEKPQPKVVDIYFTSGNKKRFEIVAANNDGVTMVLTKNDGKEVNLNYSNVNFIEEVS